MWRTAGDPSESYATDGYHLVVAVAPAKCHRRIGSHEVNLLKGEVPVLRVRRACAAVGALGDAPVASYARDGGVRGGGQVHVSAQKEEWLAMGT